jgi:DTW domain-containing protein YfiP
MHRSLCICALLPRLETRTRVVLIVHQLEAPKPTNTGLLAARCLPNSAVVYRGRAPEAAPLDLGEALSGPAGEPADAQRLVLYPHPSATPLEAWRDCTKPVVLVVPDGTWRQASRTRARLDAQIGDVPCVALPAAPSIKRLRTAHAPHQLATLEAIAIALGILEGRQVEEALLRIYRVMTDRTLWSNGRVSADQVTGGIPPGVQSHNPFPRPIRDTPESA